MRKIIESTLISADGVFAETDFTRFFAFHSDDTYLQDGLGLLLASDALIMGRTTYESWSRVWPNRNHPWTERLNAIPKYVFSATLETASWNNSTIVRGDVAAEVIRLKEQKGGNLIVFGHGLLGETLLKGQLVDRLDLWVHPLVLGHGRQFFRPGLNANLKLVATKQYTTGLVGMTYELV
jgi:dihydrofolate reductase